MAQNQLDDFRICTLATNGFEQSELLEPLKQLRERGATVEVVSPESGEIRGWDKDDWGKTVSVDKSLADAHVGDYDALVLPGGQINPDLLRVEKAAVELVKAFADAEKPIAAVCHAPWLLIEAGLAANRRITGYHSIRTDLKNAGGIVFDEPVIEDDGIITSRNPDDLDAFVEMIAKTLLSRRKERKAA